MVLVNRVRVALSRSICVMGVVISYSNFSVPRKSKMTNTEDFEKSVGKISELTVDKLSYEYILDRLMPLDPIIHAGMTFRRYEGLTVEQTLVLMLLHVSYGKARLSDQTMAMSQIQLKTWIHPDVPVEALILNNIADMVGISADFPPDIRYAMAENKIARFVGEMATK